MRIITASPKITHTGRKPKTELRVLLEKLEVGQAVEGIKHPQSSVRTMSCRVAKQLGIGLVAQAQPDGTFTVFRIK